MNAPDVESPGFTRSRGISCGIRASPGFVENKAEIKCFRLPIPPPVRKLSIFGVMGLAVPHHKEQTLGDGERSLKPAGEKDSAKFAMGNLILPTRGWSWSLAFGLWKKLALGQARNMEKRIQSR